jgi:hypothetical protein
MAGNRKTGKLNAMTKEDTEYISRAELARRAGCSGPAIAHAIEKQYLFVNADNNRIDFNSKSTQAYVKKIKSRQSRNWGSGRPPKRGRPKKIKPSLPLNDPTDPSGKAGNYGRQSNLSEEEIEELANERTQLEVAKLRGSVVATELKNRNARAELIDFKFLNSAVVSCLQSAINQFNALPESVVDDLMSITLAEGVSARAKLIKKMIDRINSINVSVGKSWQRTIDNAEEELGVRVISSGK